MLSLAGRGCSCWDHAALRQQGVHQCSQIAELLGEAAELHGVVSVQPIKEAIGASELV
jgi:hypothetical protein